MMLLCSTLFVEKRNLNRKSVPLFSTSTMAQVKYIFVTGGVTSSLGKGILSASLGKLLQENGYSATILKLDPYLNVDPGTMSPYEHGECFVTEDGAETDLDLGHYERFLGISTSKKNNVTTGRIYEHIITQERRGDFLGKTVQVIPHITDEIKRCVYALGAQDKAYDIVITEIGGCVGDIESQPFIEAIRQIKLELDAKDIVFIHLTLVPYLKTSGELKTKPTQQSVKALLSMGIQPDFLICRSSYALPQELRKKIALHCNLPLNHVIEARDAEVIYEVPLMMRKEKLDERVLYKLSLTRQPAPEAQAWEKLIEITKSGKESLDIALVGKYVKLQDAYISIQEALRHAGAQRELRIDIHWISAESLEEMPNKVEELAQYAGILLAPGFGERGFEGKIQAACFAREWKIPFFGICLGMQCAVIEYARHVLKWKDACSTEFSSTSTRPVFDLLSTQLPDTNKGGTMRLGSYKCRVERNSKAFFAYRKELVVERHRHRYELNNTCRTALQEAGLWATGLNPETHLVEIIEIPSHPWFVGCQFHPEYSSSMTKPHPLFLHFVEAAKKHRTLSLKPEKHL